MVDPELEFPAIADAIKDYALFVLDPNGKILTWNEGAARIKGYRASEIIGKSNDVFYPPEDRAAGLPAELLAAAARDGRVEHEGWRLRQDGTRFWADVVISAIRDRGGILRGFAKITRDLTERRRAQEDRLVAEQAKAAVRDRDEFISVAAHELRTPLTALRLRLDSAWKLAEAGGDPRLVERLRAATQQADRLGGLVDRMLDVSRIVTGNLELARARADLGEVVGEVVDDFSDQATQRRIELRVSVEGDVTGEWDRGRLAQVVSNLVSNAIKYAAGAPVAIRLGGDAETVRLEIEDHGIGISEEDQTRIFGRFQRAAPAENYGGLGLGLHIACHIVEMHGGTISVTSKVGVGSTFTVVLPRR